MGQTGAGKTALVTGGGRGIGEAIARRLAEDGMRVVACGSREELLRRVAEEIGGVPMVVDLMDRVATDAFLSDL